MLKKREALPRAPSPASTSTASRASARATSARLLADAGHHPQPPQGRRGDRERAPHPAIAARAHGSFAAWLDAHHPRAKAGVGRSCSSETSVFTGGEIIGEFLMSIGYLPGAHREELPGVRRGRAAEAAVDGVGRGIRSVGRHDVMERRAAFVGAPGPRAAIPGCAGGARRGGRQAPPLRPTGDRSVGLRPTVAAQGRL